jgi:hypothetical protein
VTDLPRAGGPIQSSFMPTVMTVSYTIWTGIPALEAFFDGFGQHQPGGQSTEIAGASKKTSEVFETSEVLE